MEFSPLAEKVLIVIDDPKLESLVEEYIRKAGLEVRTTTEGSHTFRLVDEWKPDLLLVEITTPGMGGFRIARRVREFIFLTHSSLIVLRSTYCELRIVS